MDGQAESAPESGGLSDLASFLADTPDAESNEQEEEANTVDESTGEEADTDEPTNSEQEEADDEPQGDDEEEPAPVEKITVKVKGEDGKDETLELTPEDIAASYMRQKDYTKKTTALAERESEAVKFLTQKHEEVRSHYLQQAELSRAAITQMARIKTDDEMAQLASSDPAAWVEENQRQKQISNYLNGLNQQIEGEKESAKAQAEQRNSQARKAAYETAWSELSKDGIDKPKLQKIYADVSKTYGFSQEELGALYDHRLVRAFKDAAAYQALKAQKPAVMQKAQAAPRMPTRQQAPAQERIDKALDNKFKSGRAKLNDLAAFLR